MKVSLFRVEDGKVKYSCKVSMTPENAQTKAQWMVDNSSGTAVLSAKELEILDVFASLGVNLVMGENGLEIQDTKIADSTETDQIVQEAIKFCSNQTFSNKVNPPKTMEDVEVRILPSITVDAAKDAVGYVMLNKGFAAIADVDYDQIVVDIRSAVKSMYEKHFSPVEQPAEEPKPAETVEEPKPAKPVEEPKPAKPVEEPKPAELLAAWDYYNSNDPELNKIMSEIDGPLGDLFRWNKANDSSSHISFAIFNAWKHDGDYTAEFKNSVDWFMANLLVKLTRDGLSDEEKADRMEKVYSSIKQACE